MNVKNRARITNASWLWNPLTSSPSSTPAASMSEFIRSTDPIDFIPRPAPVAHVREAYGLVITGESMVPEYKPGETALINPLLPVMGGEVHVFYSDLQGEARATIKHLRRATATEWLVTQHNPPKGKPKEFSLSRKEWHTAHRVFGKHARL